MCQQFGRALRNLHLGQRGITGLETAIILIAFVTVSSVLAYGILTAGIFSAEEGKQTVYSGLEQAQTTMEISGSVLGLSPNQSRLEQVQFNVGLAIPNQKLDMDAVVVNFWDDEVHAEGLTATMSLSGTSTERGSSTFLEKDEQFTITVTIPGTATVETYETFSVQLTPPTGAALIIRRTLPGALSQVMDLQ